MKESPQNQDLDLIFLMDRSGSMRGSEKDTMGGFNSFIQRESKKEFNTRVTTILFDDNYEVLYKRKPIDEVAELTENEYWVRGCTALLDAIGKTINTLDKEINNKVLFVIMTDGLENASREFSKEKIRNLIARAQILTHTLKQAISALKEPILQITESQKKALKIYIAPFPTLQIV